MGDTLWGTPAIRAIKNKFPSSNIDLLLQSQWIPVFQRNKNIRNLIPYSPKWYRQILLLPSLLKTIYDHVLIFHANRDISRILRLIRTSSILSHQNTNILPGLSERQVLQIDKPVHGIIRRIAMIEKIDIPSDGTHMEIFLNSHDDTEVSIFLKQNNFSDGMFIYLNIGGSVSYKKWPVSKFISLSKIILEKTTLSIVLGGGPEDEIRIKSIIAQLDSKRVVGTSQRSLIQNCALISKCRVLITPDSGPMHIALALKVPTICLFWTKNSQGLQRNVLNGPNYCGPLDIDPTLYSVITGSFIDTVKKNNNDSTINKIIRVEDIWNEIIKYL
jgi:ADP-heptose:LPS heptosyltransferase